MRRAFTVCTVAPEGTAAIGRELGSLVEPGDVIMLSGDLGAGKTQLTKGLAVGLGVADPVTSPTFNILLVHEGRIPLYHLDLYRLEMPDQLVDIDYDATLEGDGVSVVEWGDRFEQAAPLDGIAVRIRITADTERLLDVTSLGGRGDRLCDAWRASCRGIEGVSVGELS